MSNSTDHKRNKVKMTCGNPKCHEKGIRYLRFDILKDYTCNACKTPLVLVKRDLKQTYRDLKAKKDFERIGL